jgi:hypothetical protein
MCPPCPARLRPRSKEPAAPGADTSLPKEGELQGTDADFRRMGHKQAGGWPAGQRVVLCWWRTLPRGLPCSATPVQLSELTTCCQTLCHLFHLSTHVTM